jgi:glycine/D-amino acid oxidase-like deaminating enzyme
MKKLIGILVLTIVLTAACAPSPETIAKQTAVAATLTAESWTPTPELTPTPAYPTYSEIISTYPPDATLYQTDVRVTNVDGDGNWTFTAGTIRSCGGTPFFKCYGVKITIIENNVTIDGKVYPPGTLLTVDKDLNWIQVSSWK